MLRSSLFNFGKVFVVQNVRYRLKCFTSVPTMTQSSSNIRSIHSSAILLQNPKKKNTDLSLKAAAASSESIPTVSITGWDGLCGIYWSDLNSMNIFIKHPTPDASHSLSAIKSATLALQQAIYERKLDNVIVKTDSEYLVKAVNTYLKKWRTNDYTKLDGTPVQHKDEYKKLDELLSKIDAKFEFVPTSGGNYVMEKLKNDQRHAKNVAKLFYGIDVYNPESKHYNVIFVCAVQSDAEKYAYGIHFKGSNNLDVKSSGEERNKTFALTYMYGIIHALNVVKSEGFKDAVIVTDDTFFLRFYHQGWKKHNGELANHSPFYQKIKGLADEFNVSFCFLPDAKNDVDFKNSVNLANEALH
uniref:RNase H type-1 domain-containing protein n=1 Tax=Panagrolaimus sp. ES5 TaxID=591445 RepID=A0AC34GYQ1_9BILA